MKFTHADSIRKTFDTKTNQWLYSVVDIIKEGVVTSDPRNYWKVQKNRLKKTHPELVTACTKVKLTAGDGKNYLTDVAGPQTLIALIRIMEPSSLSGLEVFFGKASRSVPILKPTERKALSTDTLIDEKHASFQDTTNVLVDVIETLTEIIIYASVAGTPPEHISLSVGCESVVLRGARKNSFTESSDASPLYQEISWGTYEKEITLPVIVDVDAVTASTYRGLLTVVLPKIDKDRVRLIEVKGV